MIYWNWNLIIGILSEINATTDNEAERERGKNSCFFFVARHSMWSLLHLHDVCTQTGNTSSCRLESTLARASLPPKHIPSCFVTAHTPLFSKPHHINQLNPASYSLNINTANDLFIQVRCPIHGETNVEAPGLLNMSLSISGGMIKRVLMRQCRLRKTEQW